MAQKELNFNGKTIIEKHAMWRHILNISNMESSKDYRLITYKTLWDRTLVPGVLKHSYLNSTNYNLLY